MIIWKGTGVFNQIKMRSDAHVLKHTFNFEMQVQCVANTKQWCLIISKEIFIILTWRKLNMFQKFQKHLLYFSLWKYFKNYEKCILFHLKSPFSFSRYLNFSLKGTLMQIWKSPFIYIKTIPWKFRILNPKNCPVICPWR